MYYVFTLLDNTEQMFKRMFRMIKKKQNQYNNIIKIYRLNSLIQSRYVNSLTFSEANISVHNFNKEVVVTNILKCTFI